MSTSVRISVEQFEEMTARGDFDEVPHRLELIDGEIVEIPAPNPPHENIIAQLVKWSLRRFPNDEVEIRSQSSIGIPNLDSVPVPDVIWLAASDYSLRRPSPPEVLLLIEVSDSSLSYDRNTKARLYAAAGLADYWIVNIPGRSIEVLRDPGPNGYAPKLVYEPKDVIRPLAFPELAFPVGLVFPD